MLADSNPVETMSSRNPGRCHFAVAILKTTIVRWLQARCIAAVLILLLPLIQPVQAVELVVNREVTTLRVSSLELRAIFTMRLRTWPDGLPIKVFVLSDGDPATVEFSKKVLDMFPYQLRRYWDRLTFSGTGQAPIEANSAPDMYNRVSSTKGAIGYLPNAFIGKAVRVVQVGGP